MRCAGKLVERVVSRINFFWQSSIRAEDIKRGSEGNKEEEQEIEISSQATRPEFYGSKRCEAICESHNMCVNESEFIAARGNSLIFRHD